MCQFVVFYYACRCTTPATTTCGGIPITSLQLDRLHVDSEIVRSKRCLQSKFHIGSTGGRTAEDLDCTVAIFKKIGPVEQLCFACHQWEAASRRATWLQKRAQLGAAGWLRRGEEDRLGRNLAPGLKEKITVEVEHNSQELLASGVSRASEQSSLKVLERCTQDTSAQGREAATPVPSYSQLAVPRQRPARTEEEKKRRKDRAKEFMTNPKRWEEVQREKRDVAKAQKRDHDKRVDSGAYLEETIVQQPTGLEPSTVSRKMWPQPIPAVIRPRGPIVVNLPGKHRSEMNEPARPVGGSLRAQAAAFEPGAQFDVERVARSSTVALRSKPEASHSRQLQLLAEQVEQFCTIGQSLTQALARHIILTSTTGLEPNAVVPESTEPGSSGMTSPFTGPRLRIRRQRNRHGPRA